MPGSEVAPKAQAAEEDETDDPRNGLEEERVRRRTGRGVQVQHQQYDHRDHADPADQRRGEGPEPVPVMAVIGAWRPP
jgi:hypothetical protein